MRPHSPGLPGGEVPVLETERLRLRPYEPADFEAFVALNADEEVRRHVGKTLSREDSARRFQTFLMDTPGERTLAWAVILKSNGEYIGHGFLSAGDGEASPHLGVLLNTGSWGVGFGTEIARAILHYALGAGRHKEVIATVDLDHFASIRMLEKAGMKSCGEERDADGTYLLFKARRA